MDAHTAAAIDTHLENTDNSLEIIARESRHLVDQLAEANQIARIQLLHTLSQSFLIPINGQPSQTQLEAAQLLRYEIQDLVRRNHEANALGPVPQQES